MKLGGIQQARHYLYRADGALAAGGTPQLVIGQSQARSFLKLQNLSNGPLWFEFGSAQAHATVLNGVVTSITVDNPGFNFTKPPVIEFLGGGNAGNSTFLGLNQPDGAAPSAVAKAHCVLTAGAISSIVVDYGGAAYACAPYCHVYNSDLDPYGCAVPSETSGMLLTAQSPPYLVNGPGCTTDPISVYGDTTGQQYLCRWMD